MNVYDLVRFEQHWKQADPIELTNNKSDYLLQRCSKQRGDQSKRSAELKRKIFLLFDIYLLQPGVFCKSVMQALDAASPSNDLIELHIRTFSCWL